MVNDVQASIRVRSVSKRYPGGTEALKKVELEIGPGLFGLLGPNGAGKSTLMRIICTLLEPSEGRVEVCGFDTVGQRTAVRRRVGYLPQEFGAWRLQRVEEVLDTLARLSGLADRRLRRERIERALGAVGLESVAQRKVKKLSGGMLRRLGVAQALLADPPVLVVDEPTVGLDPEERIRFRQLMADLGHDRVILLSTHIVADLGAGCGQVALLDRGEIVFQGSPSRLVAAARGRVFEVEPRLASAEGLEEVSRTASMARVVLIDGAPPNGAREIDEPTLEEAYLAFMARRGGHGSILEEVS
ncbi:MAG TPA: ATP-binding cassette domain-containing protein [Acidobacteria bacterium]|nr:ATP-binding cassette domain-containing protein [Acidobacteriota bacterium]